MAQGFYKSGMKINVQKPDNSSYKSVTDTNNMIKQSISNYNQEVAKSKSSYGSTLRSSITDELRKQYGHKKDK